MRWNRFRLETITQAEDLVISALSDAGVEGVEIEDNQPLTQDELDQMFVDIMPEGPEDDGKAFPRDFIINVHTVYGDRVVRSDTSAGKKPRSVQKNQCTE